MTWSSIKGPSLLISSAILWKIHVSIMIDSISVLFLFIFLFYASLGSSPPLQHIQFPHSVCSGRCLKQTKAEKWMKKKKHNLIMFESNQQCVISSKQEKKMMLVLKPWRSAPSVNRDIYYPAALCTLTRRRIQRRRHVILLLYMCKSLTFSFRKQKLTSTTGSRRNPTPQRQRLVLPATDSNKHDNSSVWMQRRVDGHIHTLPKSSLLRFFSSPLF